MKKLLSLLSVLTISGTAMPTVIAASPYQKGNKKLLNSEFNIFKRIKRNDDPPSLKNLITTIYIGRIEKVNRKNILKRLSEINHPILSRSDFLNNIEFENISANSAIIHASQNIYVDNNVYSIPSSIRFTLNFDSDIYNLNQILGLTNENAFFDLGLISNNNPQTILENFWSYKENKGF